MKENVKKVRAPRHGILQGHVYWRFFYRLCLCARVCVCVCVCVCVLFCAHCKLGGFYIPLMRVVCVYWRVVCRL